MATMSWGCSSFEYYFCFYFFVGSFVYIGPIEDLLEEHASFHANPAPEQNIVFDILDRISQTSCRGLRLRDLGAGCEV